jgi:hypothetical protein
MKKFLLKKGSPGHSSSLVGEKNLKYSSYPVNKSPKPRPKPNYIKPKQPGKPKPPYNKNKKFPTFKTVEESIAAVKKNGLLIRNVEKQEEDICIVAVRQNGLALRFIKNRYKTARICIIAVGQNGLALKHVKDQNEKMCLTAIKQNPMAIKFVAEKTDEMRNLARVRFNEWLDSLK